MSAIRRRRTDRLWSLHSDASGNQGKIDTFQRLVAPTISSVVNAGTSITVNISDPNTGADAYQYTYIVQRSVDGSPFTTIYTTVTGGVIASFAFSDNIDAMTASTGMLADGTTFTFPSAPLPYVTSHTFGPTSPAVILFPTTVTTADGHSMVLASGTIVTVVTGSMVFGIATPKGHNYAYKVAVQNKFETTAFSASSSVTVASAKVAQVLAAPVRVNNKVTLTWTDGNSYATGDHIEIWKDVNGTGYALMSTITKVAAMAMPTTYVDAFDFLTLVPATYSYKLRAVVDNPQDFGPFSNSQSLVVNFTLSAVTALTATPALGDTQINLAWTDSNAPSNEAGVYIYKGRGATGQFQLVASIAAGLTAYSDIFTTEPGQTYSYRVQPFNALHPGPASATALATTSLLTPTISSLEQLADVGVRVSWADANAYATSYTVQRSINGAAYSTVGSPAGSDRHFDDIVALAIGDIASYKIRANNAYVNSAYSTVVSLTIGRILVAPINVAATFVRYGVVSVAWTGLNAGNRGVSLYRSINGAAPTLLVTLPAAARSYVDLFQTIPGQVYAYQVQDFDNQEIGPLSAFGVVDSPLDGPVSLQIAATVPPNHVTLQWTAFTLPQSTNEDYISIERAFGSGPFLEIARVPFGTSTTYSASTAGGIPGDAVSFRVRKVKLTYTILGNVQVPTNLGDYSETVSTLSSLTVPTSVVVTRTVAGVNHIAWNDTNTLATGFKVFRQTTLGGIATPLIQVATITNPATHFYNDTVDAAVNEVFTYSVLAFNANTSSVYSGYGTLTTKLPAPTLGLTQSGRTFITIDYSVPNSVNAGSNTLQLLRSLNGAPSVVIYTFTGPFFSGFLYTDSAVIVGDTVAYSARMFSATELGPTSTPLLMTVGDIIDTPLGNIKQIRIHGARNKFIQRDIVAVGLGGIAKISFDNNNDPVVLSNTAPAVTNSYSVISGDQNRLVAFTAPTGLTPGVGDAVLIDAGNMSVIATAPLTMTDVYTYGGGAFTFGSAKIEYYQDMESAAYLDGATGDYSGWGLVNFTPVVNMNGNYPLRLVPWSSTLNAINLSSAYNSGTTGGQTTVAAQFTLAEFLPRRLENLNGDCAFCINPVGTFTTIYRAQRLQNNYVKFAEIPARVMDFVSDGIAKIVAVTIRGDIYLVDMQFNPTNPSINIIGKVPGTPINAAGDLINPAIDYMSIELMANSKVAVCVGKYKANPFSGPQGDSKIYIFSVQGILSTTGSLKLSTTYSSIERLWAIAFDERKYLYAISKDNVVRIIRFDAGF